MPLVTTKKMFEKAYAGGYAIGAFNVNNMETIQAIVEAGKLEDAPLILQVSSGARKYANPTYLKKLVEAAVLDSGLPIALHLDHGDSYELCKDAIDGGFTSVMIDASKYPLGKHQDNKKASNTLTTGLTVEAELGKLAELRTTSTSATRRPFHKPDEVTNSYKDELDSLAIAIGTKPRRLKFKGEARLRFDILEKVGKLLPEFPIVLHGASSVPENYVEIINRYGGSMPGAKGVPEEMLRKAATMAVCKINIDSDLRLAFTAAIRKYMAENPSHFDPRQYLKPARESVMDVVRHKLVNVLGCAGKAAETL